jgi:hypothetical protein
MELVLTVALAVVAAVAALLGLFLVRGRSLERRLQLLEGMADLGQRLRLVEESIHANATAPLERKLDAIAERLNGLGGRVAALAGARESEDPAARDSEPAGDESRVRRHLALSGYTEIRVLSTLEHEGGAREFRIEAARGGVESKGSVVVAGGGVAEVRLTPVYELFP